MKPAYTGTFIFALAAATAIVIPEHREAVSAIMLTIVGSAYLIVGAIKELKS